jgi:hypothetical protein
MVAEYEVMSFEDFKAQFGASGVLESVSSRVYCAEADCIVVRQCALRRICQNIKEIETVYMFISALSEMSAKQL